MLNFGSMEKQSLVKRIYNLYADGFRSMTIGRTLWLIIAIKLVVFFAIIKFFFFPDVLKENYDNDDDRAEHVRQELLSPKR